MAWRRGRPGASERRRSELAHAEETVEARKTAIRVAGLLQRLVRQGRQSHHDQRYHVCTSADPASKCIASSVGYPAPQYHELRLKIVDMRCKPNWIWLSPRVSRMPLIVRSMAVPHE